MSDPQREIREASFGAGWTAAYTEVTSGENRRYIDLLNAHLAAPAPEGETPIQPEPSPALSREDREQALIAAEQAGYEHANGVPIPSSRLAEARRLLKLDPTEAA
jgi:hypothetical protein